MDIGAAIKKLRIRKRLTQEKLAELAHTSKPNISNLERNEQGFSPVILNNLAKALGVKVSELFRIAEEIDGSGEKIPTGSFDELRELYEKASPEKRAALLKFLKIWTDPEE